MQSPFPGMNPYLESRWSNVHVLMVGAIAAALKRSLPDGLEARPEEEVRIETVAGERLQGFRGDIALVDAGTGNAVVLPFGGATAVAEPIRISFHRGPIILRNVQIVDTRDHDRVVTVIEVLSPWNKLPGRLNLDYVAKLEAFERGGANWVEIDLLRSSRTRLPITWEDLPESRRSDYLVVTRRADDGDVLVYPFSIRDVLPRVMVPLRECDQGAVLDLQSVLDRVYTDGPFDSIDYSRPPEPPLTPDHLAWLAFRQKGTSA